MAGTTFEKAVTILNKRGGDWQPKNVPNHIVNKKFGRWQMYINGSAEKELERVN